MCLAIPMKIQAVDGDGKGRATVNEVVYDVDLSLIDSPRVGEFVIVHAGFAIERLDEAEAAARLELFRTIADLGRNEGLQ